MLRSSIYCEAVFQPQDIYYEGSEDEDYDDAVARKQRYEAAGQQFLAGRVPLLLSATLKGPFEEESGWVNPWRSKNRTAHPQNRPESQNTGSQCSPKRPAASAFASAETQAIEVLKNAECALPSPESLKQAPFTEAQSRLRGKVADLHDWRGDIISLSSTKDGYDSWVASSPSRKPSKRKSRSSSCVNGASGKRQRTESLELEIETPALGRRRTTTTTNVGERRTKTKTCLRNSSIYSHIRELTSKLPTHNLSSDDEDTDDADDSESHITHPSIDLSSTKVILVPRKDSPNKALHESVDLSSPLSSPFSQPSLLRALSPVSLSSAQTPTKQVVPAAQSCSRPQSSSGLSCLSEAPTSLSGFSDQEMLGVDSDDGDDDNDSMMVPESHSREEELSFPETLEANNERTSDSVPPAAPTAGSDYEEHTSSSDDAITAQNVKDDFMDGLKANFEMPRGLVMPLRATPPTRMAHPIIYDDAEGSDHSSPDSSITALSSAQQLAASQSEAANLSRDEEGQASCKSNITKTNSPPKSSALQSLSPRNGRINSRPALKKIVQHSISSPRKSPTAIADKALHFQEEDSQHSKENIETKAATEAKENPLPSIMNASISMLQPSLSELAADLICKADHSKVDQVQEEPMARDTVALPTTCFSLLPTESASPTEVDSTVQSNVSPNVPELAESSLAQQEISTDSQPSDPTKDAGLDMFEAQTNGDTSEKPNEPGSTAPVTDDHSWTHQQQQQNQTLTPTEAAKSLVIPPQSIDTYPPPSEDLRTSAKQVPKRLSTPEPQFAFTSFSSFISPSPSHRRQGHYSSDGILNGIAPTSQGILVSSRKGAWRSTASKKRVSWAPLPHEEMGSSGENISSGMDTSSSLSRGRDRAVSPPPPPSTSLASDSLTERDMNFGDHFAAVADRSKGTQPQSVPTVSGHGSCSPGRQSPVTAVEIARPTVDHQGEEKGAAKLTGGWDDEDPTDVVQDIFNEMDDFLQVWDVDAELDEARKADKVRATSKKQAEALSEVDMDMGITSQFF